LILASAYEFSSPKSKDEKDRADSNWRRFGAYQLRVSIYHLFRAEPFGRVADFRVRRESAGLIGTGGEKN